MLISIIIPLYNKATTIQRTIESVLSQRNTDWELIIVDDGSTDGSFERIESYIDNKRIKYFYKENGGVGSARNFGAKQAAGEYLLFLDADDSVHNEWLSSFELKTLEGQFDIIFCGCNIHRNENVKIVLPGTLGRMHKEIEGLFLAGTFCVKRALFANAGGYDERLKFSENYELGMRLLTDKVIVSATPRALVDYNDNIDNKTSNNLNNRLEANLLILDKYRQIYRNDVAYFSGLMSMTGYLLEKKNNRKEAKKLFWQCFRMRPFYIKNLYRLITVYVK